MVDSCFHLPSTPTGCRSASVARHGLKGRRHVAKINGLAFFSTGRPLRVNFTMIKVSSRLHWLYALQIR
ncbi:hypothetical protein EYF80_006015 [Liparis tanakae]|uniref:Uncharacterized protein n=1 Tax=Liparis tanakae TaxID=230148 RepID=A0A4Z2J0U6_9TELE|nr:hypothetical protein EYF80_006015 [Liparis tanakae]